MSSTAPMNSALPIAPPMQSPMQMPVDGGGAAGGVQSPLQAPIRGGGGAPSQSPMQVPQPSAIQGAYGGGQMAQPALAAPVAVAPAVAPAPAPAAAAPVTGGGALDPAALGHVLQQLVTTLTALVTALQAQMPAVQAQAGAAAVQGGGAVAGQAGPGADAATGGAVTGGGAPGKDPVQAPPGGCGCGCGTGPTKAAGQAMGQAPSEQKSDEQLPEAPPLPGAATTARGRGIDPNANTVKGRKMTAEQAKLAETVLRVGGEMGANRKVMETAVSTMIQESMIKNDSSVDSKDLDSLGLFQQRPSAGWGTREQISDPAYAARKFFEKAIANDRKDPDQPKTQLAQSVQISAFPNAYAQWDAEAEKIVADYLG